MFRDPEGVIDIGLSRTAEYAGLFLSCVRIGPADICIPVYHVLLAVSMDDIVYSHSHLVCQKITPFPHCCALCALNWNR